MRRSSRGRTAPPLLAATVLLFVGLALIVGRPPASSASAPVLLAAGDIDGCGAGAGTAQIVDGIDGAVAVLGDNAYPAGAPSDYAQCYDRTWGRLKDRTHPVPGNHDYDSPRAPGYFGYFGAAAGPAGKGYYSYDVAGWHIVAVNSNCDQIDCNAEGGWLDADLTAHPAPCILAYWHHPRYSSGSAGDNPTMNTFWKVLYAHGASVVLNGHDHDYERFAPQDPNGHLDPARGIRQFIVGTGGGALGSLYGAAPNSEVRNNRTFGVLQLSLRPDGYDWNFIPVGKGFTDSGSDSCRGAAPSPTTAPPPPGPSGPPAPGPSAAPPAAPSAAPVPAPAPSPSPSGDTGPSSYHDRSGAVGPPATAAPPSTAPSRAARSGPRPATAPTASTTPSAGVPLRTAPAMPAPASASSTAPAAVTGPASGPAAESTTDLAAPPPEDDAGLVSAISRLSRAAATNGKRPDRGPLTLVAVTALLLDCALLAACGRGSGSAGSRPGSGRRPAERPRI